MATTWYMRQLTWLSGEGPAADYYSADSASANDWPWYTVNFKLDASPGSAQYTNNYKGIVQADSPQYNRANHFVSPELAAQTLTGGQAGYVVAVGVKESSGSMNFYHRIFVYIWRSGSGNVKTISPGTGGVGTSCPNEHGTSERECVITFTGTAGDFSILDGDRLVVELWSDTRNTKETSYTATIYYDGTDTTMADDSTTSDAGAYFTCPQTLNLSTGGVSLPVITETLSLAEALD